jgi:MerR family transcriptional regulator, light-induced transcriptional regulator
VTTEPARLRIGALSRSVGVSPELLRAWERRYGLLRPLRSPGGFRLYSGADEERVRAMRRHLDAGVPAAEAARLTLALAPAEGVSDGVAGDLERLSTGLRTTLDALDEPGAQAAFDRLLATFTLETVLRDVVLPYLHALGERWERAEATVTQEHFASNLIRGRLLGLARGWGRSGGPAAVLACAPGELHDLSLIAFGLVLGRRGWSITYLGQDTPIATLHDAVRNGEPRLVVIAALAGRRLRTAQAELSELAQCVAIGLAGPAATASLARATGAFVVEGDPVSAAERIAAELR